MRFGPYEIIAAIGKGGMGEVFRARDTRLNRDVAIKTLPALFGSDPDRAVRFTREAHTLAALNHPNIAQVHGLEEDHGLRALVMELVAGDDLSDVIARGPVPAVEAVAIARQIAAALEAAHEQGIIHRDLKPANVKVRPDGTVKVLDFGLAKALAPEAAASSPDAMLSPTLTQRGTQLGTIIGTAAYMAPEQAKGKAVDRRADIWAFGVVLYEMLTGARAFDGEDMSEVLATILKTEPDWQSLPPETPPSIRRLLRRCLEKDPRKRLSSIGDARLELEETEAPVLVAHAPVPPRRYAVIAGIAGLMAATAVVTVVVMQQLGDAGSMPAVASAPVRLSIALPEGDVLADTNHMPLAISPDGSRIAYVASRENGRKLFLRNLGDSAPVLLAGAEGARMPFFSPDGQWIGFFTNRQLKKVAVASGAVQQITDTPAEPRGAVWTPDGTIYYAPHNISPLKKVPASGGSPTDVTQLDTARGEISHRWPQLLADGSLMFSVWTGPGPDEHSIFVQNPAGTRRQVLNVGDTPRFVAPGYLTYGRLDALFAVPWRDQNAPVGDVAPISLSELPRIENEGASDYVISTNGTLAYIAGGPARYSQRPVWVDRTGAVEPLPLPPRDYEAVALSPDGSRAVLQIREGTIGLWLYDFARRTLTPFATTDGSSQGAVWTSDGRRIVYRGTRQGTRNLYWKAADGSGEEERLTTKPDVVQTPTSVSPDGQWVAFSEGGGATPLGATWVMRLVGDRTPRLFLANAVNGQFSPDGKWMAYQSAESGSLEVYVAPFPGPGPRILVSAGGDSPTWSAAGHELFYTRGDKLMSVAVTPGASLSVGAPRQLFEGRYRGNLNTVTAFDVSADGKRFIRIQQAQPERPITHIEVVLNWGSQLHR
jgi:serine/threonine-protein kinase